MRMARRRCGRPVPRGKRSASTHPRASAAFGHAASRALVAAGTAGVTGLKPPRQPHQVPRPCRRDVRDARIRRVRWSRRCADRSVSQLAMRDQITRELWLCAGVGCAVGRHEFREAFDPHAGGNCATGGPGCGRSSSTARAACRRQLGPPRGATLHAPPRVLGDGRLDAPRPRPCMHPRREAVARGPAEQRVAR